MGSVAKTLILSLAFGVGAGPGYCADAGGVEASINAKDHLSAAELGGIMAYANYLLSQGLLSAKKGLFGHGFTIHTAGVPKDGKVTIVSIELSRPGTVLSLADTHIFIKPDGSIDNSTYQIGLRPRVELEGAPSELYTREMQDAVKGELSFWLNQPQARPPSK